MKALAINRPDLTLAAAAQMIREADEPRTWLYFIQAGADGPVKIGLATDPADRLSTLQQGNPEPLHLRAIYRCFKFEERQLHREFAADRIRGEWFKPSDELLALANALNAPFALEELAA